MSDYLDPKLVPLDVRAGLVCPDCTAVVGVDQLEHADTCPIRRGIDATCAADRAWFAAHPDATHGVRDLTAAEVADLRALGVIAQGQHPDGWWVVVHAVEDGLRVREYHDPAHGRLAKILDEDGDDDEADDQ